MWKNPFGGSWLKKSIAIMRYMFETKADELYL